MKTNRHIVCVVYDPLIEKHLGTKTAQAFDWLYSLIHLREGAGTVRDGRRWVKFTYKQLEQASNALPNAHAWRRALDKLEKWGLILSEESEKKDGKWYAIHFFAVRALIGHLEFSNGYELDMKNQPTEKWLTPHIKEDKSEQNAQPEGLSKLDSGSEQIGQTGLSKMHSWSEQIGQTSIYIDSDSSFDSKEDSTSPSGDGVTAENAPSKEIILEKNELPAPKDVFSAVGRILYPGVVVDEEMRKTIQRVIGTIQNTQIYVGAGQKEKPLLDPTLVEDYGIWRMLIDESGRSGFPAVQEFLDDFRFRFFKWYWTASNRAPIDKIKTEFSDWRTRLFVGDYGEFRKEVQARIKPVPKQGKGQLADWQRTPYGETPAVKATPEDIEFLRKKLRGE